MKSASTFFTATKIFFIIQTFLSICNSYSKTNMGDIISFSSNDNNFVGEILNKEDVQWGGLIGVPTKSQVNMRNGEEAYYFRAADVYEKRNAQEVKEHDVAD